MGSSDVALLLPTGAYEIKPMEPKSGLKRVAFFWVILQVSAIVGFVCFCQDRVVHPLSKRHVTNDGIGRPSSNLNGRNVLSYDEIVNDELAFDMNSHDVMVFLHMQKTGGTSFGNHLMHDLDLKRRCTCPIVRNKCNCFRPHSNQSWLFSRYTNRWKCDLHADWTELKSCVYEELDEMEGYVAGRRYFYVTFLREPIARYLSEFKHVQRGATWKDARLYCGGRSSTDNEQPSCYNSENWEGVSVDEFMKCEFNLASNRQTRMLSDLELVGCYNSSFMPKAERDRVMLASAQKNLVTMAYFGLTEFQKISQYVFEETFNLRFAVSFEQNYSTVAISTMPMLSNEQAASIASLNSLDLKLYDFAKNLLFERFNQLKARDEDFQQRFRN